MKAFKNLPLILLTLVLGGNAPASAGMIGVIGDSCNSEGLFAYHENATESQTRLYLVRADTTEIKRLFTVTCNGSIKPPICLYESVITVNAGLLVRKYDTTGRLVFETKPEGLGDEVALMAGKLGDNHIWITTLTSKPKSDGWDYQLQIVKVSGEAPQLKHTFSIIKPDGRIQHTRTDLVVIGAEEVQRIKIPEGIK